MEKIVNHTGKTTLFSPVVTYKKLVPDFGTVPLYQKNAVITTLFLDKNGLVFLGLLEKTRASFVINPRLTYFSSRETYDLNCLLSKVTDKSPERDVASKQVFKMLYFYRRVIAQIFLSYFNDISIYTT